MSKTAERDARLWIEERRDGMTETSPMPLRWPPSPRMVIEGDKVVFRRPTSKFDGFKTAPLPPYDLSAGQMVRLTLEPVPSPRSLDYCIGMVIVSWLAVLAVTLALWAAIQ